MRLTALGEISEAPCFKSNSSNSNLFSSTRLREKTKKLNNKENDAYLE